MGAITKMLLSCLLLALASSALSQNCPDMTSTVCSGTDVMCDMGMTGSCWNGDYCMPEGSVCPPSCYTPEPSMCSDPSDVVCDNGMDLNGCWMGDFCLSAGKPCPPVCYPMQPSNCSATEMVCDMGYNGACWNGDYCMPEGSVCPISCYPPEPSMCYDPSDVVCDNGVDMNACWLG